jgi:aspartyl-tRNA(Asn)/glutamyl-tRNA(Gln) amidotransferase subunit A
MRETIQAAAAAFRQGQLSPIELVEGCLDRIRQEDSWLRAWVLVDAEEARRQAEQRQAELQHGHWRGPLHGIPLAVKDIFDVFDWPTAGGSRLWQHSIARQDATVVARLRQAGAVLLGKTVTTAYASFDPPPTRNPYRGEHTPGGSSSGSAAALACGMCLGALASQTGGSVTRPASYCGVAGCKPTFGRVSCHGVLPLAPSLDHPGVMARCVRDLAILLQVISGPDSSDPSCAAEPVADWWTAVQGPGQPPRIGRLRGLFESRSEPIMSQLLDQAARTWQQHGATVVDVALPAAFAEVLPRHRTIMAVESAAYHQTRLRRHPDDYPPRIRELIEEGLAYPAPEYARCREHQVQLRRDMLGCLADVDILLTPATTGPAPAAATTGDPACNSPWSYVGFPTVCFLAGWSDDGLPLAVQLAGQPWSEGPLLAASAWCEDALEVPQREPPSRPTH